MRRRAVAPVAAVTLVAILSGVLPAAGQETVSSDAIRPRVTNDLPVSLRVRDAHQDGDDLTLKITLLNQYKTWYVVKRTPGDSSGLSDTEFPYAFLLGPHGSVDIEATLGVGGAVEIEASRGPIEDAEAVAWALAIIADIASRVILGFALPPDLFWRLARGEFPLEVGELLGLQTAVIQDADYFHGQGIALVVSLLVTCFEAYSRNGDRSRCSWTDVAESVIEFASKCLGRCLTLFFRLFELAGRETGRAVPLHRIRQGFGKLLRVVNVIGVVKDLVIPTMGSLELGTARVEVEPVPETPHYFGLGDSIAAGHGLEDDGSLCRRSPKAYPQQVADRLGRRNPELQSFVVACSGATVQDIGRDGSFGASGSPEPRIWLSHQVDEVLWSAPRDAVTVVSITAGANDLDWASPMSFLRRMRVDTTKAFEAWIAEETEKVRSELLAQVRRLTVRPNIRVILTDVHNPFNETSNAYVLASGPGILAGKGCGPLSFDDCHERTEHAIHELNTRYRQVRDEAGGDRVLVADVHGSFHEIPSNVFHASPRRLCGWSRPDESTTWVQSRVLDLVAGTIDLIDCFHPNQRGADAYARRIIHRAGDLGMGADDAGVTSTAIVMDVSGSMGDEVLGGGTKLGAAQSAAGDIVTLLAADATVGGRTGAHDAGLVTFSSGSEIVSHLTSDAEGLRSLIDSLAAGGGTDMGAGIEVGLNVLTRGTGKAMILLSDGMTNEGLSSEQILSELVPRARAAGVRIFTVGLGDPGNLDEPLLRRIAEETNGSYGLADARQTLRSTFVRARHESAGTVVLDRSGIVRSAEVEQLGEFTVPEGQQQLQATVVWPGSEVDVELTDPRGRTVDATYPGAHLFTDGNPKVYIVEDPRPGAWLAAVIGTDVDHAGEEFHMVASTRDPPPAATLIEAGAPSSGVSPLLLGGLAWMIALLIIVLLAWRRPAGVLRRRFGVVTAVMIGVALGASVGIAAERLWPDASEAAPARAFPPDEQGTPGTPGGGAARTGSFDVAALTGSPRQRWAHGAEVPPIMVDDVVVSGLGDAVVGVAAGDGRLLWRTDVGSHVRAAAGGAGTVYAAHDGGLTALRSSDGRRLWTHRTGGRVLTAPSVSDDAVVVADDTGSIVSLSAEGGVGWRASVSGGVFAPPARIDGLVLVAGGSRLAAFEERTGALRWTLRTGEDVAIGPVAAYGLVFVGTVGGDLLAAGTRDGLPRWSMRAEDARSIAVSDGRVFVGDGEMLLAVDLGTGTRSWRAAVGAAVMGVAVARDTVYVLGADHVVRGLDVATGDARWEHEVPGPVTGALTPVDGGLLLAAEQLLALG